MKDIKPETKEFMRLVKVLESYFEDWDFEISNDHIGRLAVLIQREIDKKRMGNN